jgi:hypothetical protein
MSRFHARRFHAAAASLVLVGSLAVALLGPRRAGEAVAAAAPPCPVSAATPTPAVQAARACGGRVEIMSERTEYTQVFAEADGSRTAQIYAGPVRIRDGRGGWTPVDLNLVRTDDGGVVARAHPFGVRLSGAGGAGRHDLATLGTGTDRLALGWYGALPEPVLSGTTATYVEALPGVDLVVEVTRSGFEQFLVVKTPAAARAVQRVRMPMRGGSAIPRANGKEVQLVSGGEVRASVGAALMWDAKVDPRTGLPARVVPADLAIASARPGDAELTLVPDAAFLSDPSTVYPVTIDPAITGMGPTVDTYVESDIPTTRRNTSTELILGTYNDGGVKARSLLRFDGLAPVYGAYINQATLFLYETWAWSCFDAEWQLWVTGWFDGSATWQTQPAWHSHRASSWMTTGRDECEADDWVGIDATSWFQFVADDRNGAWGMGLRATQEENNGSARDSWKRFRSQDSSFGVPNVSVNYNLAPTVVGASYTPSLPCATGAGRPHVTSLPQLMAQVSDAEGANVSTKFEWWVPGGALIGSSTVGPAGSGTWAGATPPAGDLPDGGTYAWRAQGYDGLRWGGWSPWCEFTVDTQPPVALSTDPASGCVSTSGGADVAGLPRVNATQAGAGLRLRAVVNDVNGGTTQAQFEWWPKATRGTSGLIGSVTTAPPAAVGTTFQSTVAAGTLAEGQAYSWRVRGHDGGNVKAWSPWCDVVVDTTAPAPPTVSAGPDNGLLLVSPGSTVPAPPATAVVGRPTRVTFQPAGGTDTGIAGYVWGLNTPSPDRWVAAGPTGAAVVTVEPLASGFTTNQLTAIAVDRAGNRSPLPPSGYTTGFRANPAAAWWSTTVDGGPVPDLVAGNDLVLGAGVTVGRGVMTLTGTGEAVAGGPAVDTTASFTVSAWVRPTDLDGDGAVLSQDGSSESAFRLMYRAEADAWCFATTQADLPPDPTLYPACASTPPVLGVWTHLAGVYDAGAGMLRLYVDGALAGSLAFAAPWAAEGPFVVGRAQKAALPRYRFSGDIADVRAWPRALDAVGLAALATLPPLAGRWGMDDPADPQAADNAGLAAVNPATPTGGAGWAPGHTGGGLQLDGATGAADTSGAVVATTRSYTVSAWVRVNATAPTQSFLGQEGARASGFYLQQFGGTWCMSATAADTDNAAAVRACAPGTSQAGVWTHLTGVYDASAGQLRLYVGGVLRTTAAYTTAWSATGGLTIGRARVNGAAAEFTGGAIDDVRAFTGALSPAQIAYLATL